MSSTHVSAGCDAGVWTIQRNPDGTRFYFNKALNASKAQLTEEEQQLLVPELNAYDNDVVMSLKVRTFSCLWLQSFCSMGYLSNEKATAQVCRMACSQLLQRVSRCWQEGLK